MTATILVFVVLSISVIVLVAGAIMALMDRVDELTAEVSRLRTEAQQAPSSGMQILLVQNPFTAFPSPQRDTSKMN